MPLESGSKLTELNPLWPLGSDPKSEGDDHIRLVKRALSAIYPIGSIIENTTGTNPSEYIGGTWENYGDGRVTRGIASGAAGQTGGADEITADRKSIAATQSQHSDPIRHNEQSRRTHTPVNREPVRGANRHPPTRRRFERRVNRGSGQREHGSRRCRKPLAHGDDPEHL